uniref:Glycosyltransferase family 32 protein n=1 Tax=Macrostomum lignano TaxID=282301 RepID=A0A1I8JCM8_9PLAT
TDGVSGFQHARGESCCWTFFLSSAYFLDNSSALAGTRSAKLCMLQAAAFSLFSCCLLLLLLRTRHRSGFVSFVDGRYLSSPARSKSAAADAPAAGVVVAGSQALRAATQQPTEAAAAASVTAVSRSAVDLEAKVGADGVVRIFHQSWKTSKLPPRFQRWSESFSQCLPDWQRRLWTDEDNEKLVAKHFAWFLPTYKKLHQPVQKADVSRLLYMYKYGGAYCDLDCECLNPFGHLFVNVSLAFGAMAGHSTGPEDDRYMTEGQVENSFMYSVPGHPFVMELIKQVEKRPFGSPEDTTGPYLLMRGINRKRKSPDGMPATFRGLKYLTIFPPRYFNPFTWLGRTEPACKDKGGFTRAEEELCKAAFRNSSYVLQYHTQVWLAGGRHLNKD